jgi:uncharacterized protein (DUF1697 family)
VVELMETYIALLRGINVSGQRMIKMEELKTALAELNFSNIRSYIQSVVVPVIIRTRADLEKISNNNPFLGKRNENVDKLHVTLLAEEPGHSNRRMTEENSFLPDEFVISGKDIYLYCPNGYGRTKLTNQFFENKLKTTATTRNWKTIEKLMKM